MSQETRIRRTGLELKIPPLALVLLWAAAMRGSSYLVPALGLGIPGRRVLVGICLGLGALIALPGILAFLRAKTTIHPMHPENASALVTSGIYRWSRNPMYVGVLFVLTGWALWLSHLLPFFFLPLFVAYLNRFQIQPEEKALKAKFGEAFTDYMQSVRRWL